MTKWTILLLSSVLVGTLACVERAGEEGAAVQTTATEADVEAALSSLNDRFEQALIAGDSTALGEFYVEDAVVLPPNGPKSEGRAAIRSFWGSVISSTPVTSVSLEADRVTVAESGELAYEVGRYSLGGSTPDGQSWQDTGKYLVVWHNVGGEWKLAADMWSSDQPPPAPSDTGTGAADTI